MSRVVVIGAGLAGITAARELATFGHEPVVLEGSSSWGGRLATRAHGSDRLDLGAPFFTVRDPTFRARLQPLVESGRLFPWADRLHRWDGQVLRGDPLTAMERRFASAGGMAEVAAALGEGLDVRFDSRVVALEPHGPGWRVAVDSGPLVEADAVVCAVPAPRALALAAPAPIDATVRTELARVTFDPCLVVLAAVAAPAPAYRAIAAECGDLQWIGVESSKRPSSTLLLALHASAGRSREWFAESDEVVVGRCLAAGRAMGAVPDAVPQWTGVERWPWARPTQLATARALLSEAPPIVFGGDWSVAPRVEGAFLAGLAMAERLMGAGI